jgi:iron uptake system component EfeO
MTRPARRRIALSALAGGAGLLALGGCSSVLTEKDAAPASAGAITVNSSADACEVGAAEAPSGNVVFQVTNSGDMVTEFYLLGEDGLRIVGEVENIGPGITRDLVVRAAPGSYFTSCKPGMVGDGIRAAFTVTDSGADLTPAGPLADQLTAATTSYAAYVRDQVAQLVADTDEFVAAYLAGDDDMAQGLYASTRMHWERIEPVAESFGDLDPKLDLREADLEEGQEWTGWHRIEKDLWPPSDYTAMTQSEREEIAELLVADTAELSSRVRDMTFTADRLGNGAKELLDEVATGKVTGEEEFWSHTDLWDFQANVDGARVMFEALAPVVEQNDADLAEELETRFAGLQVLLDQYRVGDGFVLYTDLTAAQVKELAAAVDALGEPLSKLTAAVVL